MIKPIVERVGDELKINLFPKQAEFINSEVDDILFGGAASGGKQLWIETEIPVPLFVDSSGFRKMGDLKVGDYVLSPNGHQVKIIWTSEPDPNPEAYAVTFDTGEVIFADAKHQWLTMTGSERMSVQRLTEEFRICRKEERPSRAIDNPRNKGVQLSVTKLNKERIYQYKIPPIGKVRTTKEILETLYFRETRINHSISNCEPIHFQEQELPVEPYLFGLWLGDGYSSCGNIGMLESDWIEIEKHVPSAVNRFDLRSNRKQSFLIKRFPGLTTILRRMGILHNKHIPSIYIRSSYDQRIALLQGILDTDGSCDKQGSIEIGFKSKKLIEGTHELISSLGIKSRISKRKVFCKGKCYGDFYRIIFIPTFPAFRLPRKFYRQKLKTEVDKFRRFIVSVKKIDSIPMRCIQVENEDGLYLATRSFIPTHNSAALLIFAALRRMNHPGSNGLILRRTFAQLEKSLILRSREIYPLFGATYNDTKKVWNFPNGSRQQFGYLEKDADVYGYHSDEYHDICYDEASLFTEFQINYMTSRCRSTLPGCKALIRLASNPGNVGHLFLKKKYIEPSKVHKIWRNEITGSTISFISAKIGDNPAMMELDPGYKDRLRVLGDQKFLALAEGNWDVFEGAYFDFDLRPGYGVLPYRRIPDTDTYKYLSMDWGYAEPACVLWWEVMPSGRIFTYRELYVTKMSPKELAKRVIEMSPASERYEYIACPPEIWGRKVELEGGGESIQSLMQPVFADKIPMQQAPNARVPGWTKMREFMSIAGDGRPWWQISPVCENLIRTIPTAMHDEKQPEDVSKLCEDHPLDCSRYFFMTTQNIPNQNEILSPYERLFGIKNQENKNQSFLPLPGRSGY